MGLRKDIGNEDKILKTSRFSPEIPLFSGNAWLSVCFWETFGKKLGVFWEGEKEKMRSKNYKGKCVKRSLPSQIALEHIGMIVVDEIQNCVKAKQGRNLVGCLTQLINNAGIVIVMVGTPDCVDFFESEMFLARRTVGLRYGSLEYDDQFKEICGLLFSYCYVKQEAVLTEDVCYWLCFQY